MSRPGGDDLKQWQVAVAREAAEDAHAPAELLGAYLDLLTDAALSGRRPTNRDLATVADLGRLAAEQGVDANQAVDLYLSAAWRLWQRLPTRLPAGQVGGVEASAEAVLRVVTDAVDVLVEGHQDARRQMIRQEESARRELVDDLLRGDADVSRLVERAEPFGLDLSRRHQVLLAGATASSPRLEDSAMALERAVVDGFGDRDVLIATKDELLVVLIPGEPPAGLAGGETADPARFVHRLLSQQPRGSGRWRVSAGRPYAGAYGIARSYEEAREALLIGRRLGLDSEVMPPRDVLVYRVLGRDQAALVDLVDAVLTPLLRARGGARDLLDTLDAYFATGTIATQTARRLHVSVRTVGYRLARIHSLTGHDPTDPAQHLTLHMAVTGARLLGWPGTPLPTG